ncbi:hypothetical protein [Chitinophaga varians]|uniref:hypothetical protein n=1 Tax=Chitinophaga varians TaxID=2202339 RepID=UPI00165F8131|nr:hypothetical protein [Chitinophaga varians]MBC9911880.1 hypothetical protein [Chitinophaga varians]
MKKQLLALAGMALLFAACSKTNTPLQAGLTTSSGLLKGFYSVTDTSRIAYNNDQTVSKVTYGWIDGTDVGGGIDTMKYANGVLSEVWQSDYDESQIFSPSMLNLKLVYASNKLQKIVHMKYPAYDSARYNANGKIEKVFTYSGLPGAGQLRETDSLVWTGNNITQVFYKKYTISHGVESVYAAYTDTYTFDSKPNWEAPLGFGTISDRFIPTAMNANNVLTVVRTEPGQPVLTNTYVYEYNAQNKVTKSTVTYQFIVSPRTEVTVFEYYQ